VLILDIGCFIILARKVNNGAIHCRFEYRDSKGCHNSRDGTQHVYVYRKVASTLAELFWPNRKNHKIYDITLEGTEEETCMWPRDT